MSQNTETPMVSQKWGIIAFVGVVALFATIIIVFLMRANSEETPVATPTSAPSVSPSELLPVLPDDEAGDPSATALATLTPDEYNNEYVKNYKNTIETYLTTANTWSYQTNVDEWRNNILNTYASLSAPYPDDLAWLTGPMMTECLKTRCEHTATVKFVEETAPGSDSGYAAYYLVTVETSGSEGVATEDTLWLVRLDTGDPAKIVTADKQDSLTPPQD